MTSIANDSRPTDRAIAWLQGQLPKIVLSPSLAAVLVFVYGFILWTIFLSFSKSKMLPVYRFAGLDAYEKLWGQPNWYIALENLAIYGVLYIGLCIVIGLLLAILLDQRVRIEGGLRPIYLYPMALSRSSRLPTTLRHPARSRLPSFSTLALYRRDQLLASSWFICSTSRVPRWSHLQSRQPGRNVSLGICAVRACHMA